MNENEKRRPQPELSISIFQKNSSSLSTAESSPQGSFAEAVRLRERGFSPEEIAVDIGATRLNVFRYFLRTLARDKRLKLVLLNWVPVAGTRICVR